MRQPSKDNAEKLADTTMGLFNVFAGASFAYAWHQLFW
jgi:hypothetical protein